MSFFTIVLFLVYCFGLGFTATSFVKNSSNLLERNLMRLGFGLALLPFIAVVLNLAGLQGDWRILLGLSLIYPLYSLIRNFKSAKFSFKITKSDLYILVMLLIFAVNLYVYASGAFNYPYLEDDDSWGHSEGVKYYSIVKNVFQPDAKYVRYMNPYPPTYDILLGILHQTNNSVHWTLKFFNALIISLSTIFFYFFVKELSGSKNKGLFAAFALAAIPSFLSHFIWALALSMPLYFVAFYAVERIRHDKKWWILAGLVMFTTLTSSPTHSTYFGLFFVIYLITKSILERRILYWHAASGILGLLLSFFFWWFPMISKYGIVGTLGGVGLNIGYAAEHGLGEALQGTADRVYKLSDFFIAQEQNLINNSIGVGVVLSVLTILAIVFLFLRFKHLIRKENHWLLITFVWFLFSFYAVNAAKMPVRLSPFRAWMLLAIPVCILAAEGAFNLESIVRKSAGRTGAVILLIVIIIGIYFTSAQQKIAVNTAVWPPGGFWTSQEEIAAYLWMRENLEPGTKVFGYVLEGPIIGMDMFICYWCEDIREFQQAGPDKSASEIKSFLRQRNYEYLIIGGNFAKKYGTNVTNAKLQEFAESGLFQTEFQNNGAIIFRI